MKFDRKVAENLYLGVVSDSDRFLISYTSAKTFHLVSKLIDKSQIDFTNLYPYLYERPYEEIKFHGYLSSNLNITENGFASIEITPQILKEYNVDAATPSNMINDFSNIKDVYVWTFVTYDDKNEIYKVNIRSKGPIINDIAAMYGGGGHKFASGVRTRNKDDIDKDVMDMLESISYKKESERSVYDEFKAGEVKEYSALGYMSYDIPSCWKYDEARSKENQYKSNIFVFMDDVTLMDIKSFTPYNSVTHTFGTSYESMKSSIIKAYGAVKNESKKTIKGKVWYVVTTPDYNVSGHSYHNEIYFTMSATNQHLYYVEVYVNNDTSPKKTKYLNKSIEYVLESATLLKVNE